MINAYCRSNDDDLRRYTWPTKFQVVPQVGDWVESKGAERLAKVCKIIHKYDSYTNVVGAAGEIEIEIAPLAPSLR